MKNVSQMKKINFYHIILLAFFALFGVTLNSCTGSNTEDSTSPQEKLNAHYRNLVHSTFQNKVGRYGADSRYLILVDYSIPSNQDRLFVWDTESDGIVEKFWCAHGFGGGSTAERPVFSNTFGSNCSSLGWFLVDRGVGVSSQYGYKYHAVDGLDATNSNARRREILIHTWSSVTYDYEAQIPYPMNCDYRSAGCFTTTDKGYATLDQLIKSQPKRILLLAIDGVN